MKKITLLLLATVFTFIVSSCSKTEEVAPASIIGKWENTALGAIVDTKTYSTPPGQTVKIGTSSLSVDAASMEFKADGTGVFGKETGKYTLSSDGKKVALILPTYTINLEVTSLTATGLVLSTSKLTKKAGENYKATNYDELYTTLNGAYAFYGNGGTQTDYLNSTSIQGTITFKKSL
jgi:hypothetical protein